MVDCKRCVRRGVAVGGSQDTYCSMCVHGQPWKPDYYSEGPTGGLPSKNCEGCVRDLPVIGGAHYESGRPILVCTASRYT
jgi:hypothetical protein